MRTTVLAADNDPMVLASLDFIFENVDVDLVKVSSGELALSLFRENPSKYSIVILDYEMKNEAGFGMNGDQVAIEMKRIKPSVRIIILSGRDSESVTLSCIAAGAEMFLQKSTAIESLSGTINSMIMESLDSDPTQSETENRNKISRVLKMVGRSAELAKVAELISKFSIYDEPVLILGESGAGKEGIARAVHANSNRKAKPFVAINCTAFARELLESELFGHERGAFTGAINKKIGVFEQANGGTIFLDEIGDLPFDLQVKLLRALQEKTIQPVGGLAKKIDFRVIAATHADLKSAAEQGRFRQDLYYRLRYLTVNVAPLRERPEDIEPLVHYFIADMNEKTKFSKKIADSALRKLKSYKWPGNVRELEATIREAYILADDRIGPEAFENAKMNGAKTNIDEILESGEIMAHADFMDLVMAQERKLLERAMELAGNVKSVAAQLLKLNHNTMNYRREVVGLSKKKSMLKKLVGK